MHLAKIANLRRKGVQQVWDLTVKSKHHNYIANGIVVSNCAYSLISIQLQWLRTYYPTEFYCSLFNVTKSSFDPWAYRAMAMRDGVEIELPKLGVSSTMFSVVGEKKISWGLYLIRGMSEETKSAQYALPPGDWLTFFIYIYHLGYNKRQCEAIIKCGAVDYLFPNRKQLWESYVYWNESVRPKWKKSSNMTAKSVFDLRELFQHVSDWSDTEKTEMSVHFLGGCDSTIHSSKELEDFVNANKHLGLIPAGADVSGLSEWYCSDGLNFIGHVRGMSARKVGKGDRQWDQLLLTIASEYGQVSGTITNWDVDQISQVRGWCKVGDLVAVRLQKNDKGFVNLPNLNSLPLPLIKNFSRS